MRALLTGGAGFIGSHLAERLLQLGYEVLVIDDLSTGSIENISHLKSERGFFYTIDSINNESLLAELWTMISAARLLLPAQFTGGLEPAAPYLLALLEKTDYIRVVQAALGDGPRTSALLLVPPPDAVQRKLRFFPEASA